MIDVLTGPARIRALIAAGDVAMAAVLGRIAWAIVSPALQAWEFDDRPQAGTGAALYVIWAAVLLGIPGPGLPC